jgi:hypothetical protein
MANDTRTLRIIVSGDSTSGRKALKDLHGDADIAGQKVGKLEGAFGKLGPGIVAGLTGYGVGAAFAKTIGAASDLNETVSKSQQVFGSSAAEIKSWASDAADSLGMSKQAAIDGAASFGNFFSQIGLTRDVSAQMSKKLVELSTDFASFHNAVPVDVMNAMLAATRGEYDALQRFVPTVNAATVEQAAMAESGKASAKQLTNAEKATALYNIVIRDSGAAMGDFKRTSDSAANQQRILAARMEDTGAAIGQTVLPAYQGLLKVVNDVGPFYALGTVAALVFGTQIRAAAQTASTAVGVWAINARNAATEAAAAGGKTAVFQTALGGIGNVAGKAKAGLGALTGMVGGPYGIAIAGAIAAAGYFSQKSSEQDAKNKALKNSLAELAKGFGSLANQGRDSAEALVSQSEDARRLILHSGELKLSVEDIVNALNGEQAAGDRVSKGYDDRINALTTLDGRYKDSINTFGSATDQQKLLTDAGFQNIDQVRAAIEQLKLEKGAISETTGEKQKVKEATDRVTAASQKSAEAIGQNAGAMREGKPAGEDYFTAIKTLADNTATAEAKTKALKLAMDALFGSQIGQIEANEKLATSQAEMTAHLDETKKSTDKNKWSMDAHTEAGRKNRDMVEDQAQASYDLMLADINAGVPREKATQQHLARVAALEKELSKTGLDKEEVKKLIDAYGRVPKDVRTQIETQGYPPTKAQLEELWRLQQSLKKSYMVTTGSSQGEHKGTGTQMKFAHGGLAEGPGTGVSDDILAWLSNKEFVQPRAAVDYYGVETMKAIQHKKIPKDLFKGLAAYAKGGQVWPYDVDTTHTKMPVTKAQLLAAYGGQTGMGWQAQMRVLRARFPGLALISGYRPGAHTLSGNVSYHAKGRAVDIPPRMDVFNWLASGPGRNSRELIYSPAGNRQIWNGSPHYYTGAVRGQHFNHVHWAMDNGGVLPPNSTTTVTNSTSQREYALTEDKIKDVAGDTFIFNGPITIQASGDIDARKIRTELIKLGSRNGGRVSLPQK